MSLVRSGLASMTCRMLSCSPERIPAASGMQSACPAGESPGPFQLSGPAGIGAALSAAKNGATTLLIEKDGSLGGVATNGLMSHWTGTVDSPLFREVLMRSCEEENRPYDEFAKYINPERLKITLLKMLLETGVKIRLYTFVTDAIKKDKIVIGVRTQSKSGEEEFTVRERDLDKYTFAESLRLRHMRPRREVIATPFRCGFIRATLSRS